MRKAMKISLAGVLTALSVVLLYLGAVVWFFAYIMPLVSGLLMIILTENADGKTALSVFAAVSLIAVAALPDKECALTYLFFFGYYPILKYKLDAIGSKVLRIVLKCLIFNAGIVLSQLVLVYVFGIPLEEFAGKTGILILLANVMFFIYEVLLGRVLLLYRKRYKDRVAKFLK